MAANVLHHGVDDVGLDWLDLVTLLVVILLAGAILWGLWRFWRSHNA